MTAGAVAWISLAAAALVGGRWGWRRLDRHARADWGRVWLNRLDGLNRLFCHRYHRLRGGPVPVPPSGPALIACNHVSGLDPVLLVAACRRPVRFLIAVEQYQRWYLHWLFSAMGCIPLDRDGQPHRAYRAALRALREGEVVGIFPHGGIRDGNSGHAIKLGVLSLARSAGAPVYPVHLSGVGAPGTLLAALVVRGECELRVAAPIEAGEDVTRAETRLRAVLDGNVALN